ncbi:hypothetical protein [Compostimonas suwonensis]|nr:hypothetical protein [Compostimonas suwonensis]
MFEYEQMAAPLAALDPPPPAVHRRAQETAAPQNGAFQTDAAGAAKASVTALQDRIRSMQAPTLDSRAIPTHPAIAGLLPGGALKQGAAYSIDGSASLLMTLLAAPSAAGQWCAVVGIPEFGVEAASRFGIDLERLVLIPHPGEQWLSVIAAIVDVMGVVAARPTTRASDANAARLAARLRERGSTLIVQGPWPQSEAVLGVSGGRWSGVGQGHGYLRERRAALTVSTRFGGRPRTTTLLLPAADEKVRSSAPGLGESTEQPGSSQGAPSSRLQRSQPPSRREAAG